MEELLSFLIEKAGRGAWRNLLKHLLMVRTESSFADCVWLLLLIFIGCYLLLFRFRLFLSDKTPKEKKNRKSGRNERSKPSRQIEDPNIFAWLYMYNNRTFQNYRIKYPKRSKLLFAYNLITVSVYLSCVILIILSMFLDLFRSIFLDLFFIHMYTNVIPQFIFDAFLWLHHRISLIDSDGKYS